MNVGEALRLRKSTRAFLSTPVEREKIIAIIEAAGHAPSGVNSQPWQVAVVSGTAKQQLQRRLEDAFRSGEAAAMDYRYYPNTWREPYRSRRIDCGRLLYEALGISRQEKERRLEQWAANYRAFDAPVFFFFFLDPGLETGSYLDYGMFFQSLMLAAVEVGLATCPQAALGEYPRIVKEELAYPPDSILLGGMALGYEDVEAPVNHYRTPRQPVEAYTRFFD